MRIEEIKHYTKLERLIKEIQTVMNLPENEEIGRIKIYSNCYNIESNEDLYMQKLQNLERRKRQ